MVLLITSCQLIILSPILPAIAIGVNAGEVELGFLGGVYAVTLMLTALVAGPISDRVGRRAILLTGSGFMAGTLILHWLADTYTLLLIARLITGAAAGILSGSVVAYVGDYFPYERRGWATGWVMSGLAAGQIIAIPAGILLAFQMDYRMPFVVFGFVMGATCIMIMLFVPQPNVRRNTKPLTIRNAVINYVRLIGNKTTGGAVWAYFLMFSSGGLFLFFLTVWLEETHGLTGTEIALLFVVVGIVNVVGSPIGGYISDRLGRKPIIITMCVLLSVGFAAAPFMIDGFITACLVMSVLVLFGSLRMSPIYALITELVSDERRGVLMSLTVSFGQLGFGVGAAVAGYLVARFGYISNTLAGALLLLVMAVVVWRFVPEPKAAKAMPDDFNPAHNKKAML